MSGLFRYIKRNPRCYNKHSFRAKDKSFYESLTDIKVTEEQREKLKKIWANTEPIISPDDYMITMKCGKKPDSLMAFIKFIIPARRMINDHYVYLVKKKPNNITLKGNYILNNRTKKYLLPLVFQAIDNGTL